MAFRFIDANEAASAVERGTLTAARTPSRAIGQKSRVSIMFVILSVCLLSSPSTCKQERILQSADARPPIACLVEGQSTVAEWGTAHPQWHIDKWTCVSRDRLPKTL